MIFDSHCHPQFPQYDNDREEMIRRALAADIFMICVGTDLEMSKKGIELAAKHEGIWATVGLHPNDVAENFDISAYRNILNHPKVVAVGEVGLDYYRTPELEKQKLQKEIFEKFLDLAVQNQKPVVLHCRDAKAGSAGRANADMIHILKSFNLKGMVAHSFTGTKEEAKALLDLGAYIGFNGIITFPPVGGQVPGQYIEVIKYIPEDRILVETDAPFLSPEPHRGKRNESLYILEVVSKLAEIRGIGVDKVKEATTQNSKKLFLI